VKQVKVYDNAL